MLRPLISPALASSRGATLGELDHAEVEVDDEDPLAGSRIERPLRVATTRASGSSSSWAAPQVRR